MSDDVPPSDPAADPLGTERTLNPSRPNNSLPVEADELVTNRPPSPEEFSLPPLASPEQPPSSEEFALAPVSRLEPLVGTTIDGRYRIDAVLGEGGMGVVYRCRHTIIDKKVAMKVLRSDLARDREVTERFLMEARAASAIGDEHIIDISDFGLLPDGATYFVMEFLDGQPLSTVLRGQTPVPVSRLIHIARQLGQGLAAAHDAGIVHRDLKPDNIFLIPRGRDKDFVKILDFGIAKVSSGGGQLTRAGSVFGTPHYMAPEQAAGAPVDHRGDVYSFGVILYEMACGKVPFDADNFMGILTQHMYKAPVPIRALVPPPQDVPAGLEAIILKCLSKRPEHRYQTVQALVSDLEKLRDGHVPDAVTEMMARSGGFNVPNDFFKAHSRVPAVWPATPAGAGRSWPLIAGVTGIAVAVGLVIAIFAHSTLSPASPSLPTPESRPAVAAHADPPGSPSGAKVVQVVAPTTPVVIAVAPGDAEIYRGDRDLGASPVIVDVPSGQSVELSVRRTGYVEQRIVIDANEPKRVVRLERVHAHAGTARHESTSGGSATRPKVAPKDPKTTPEKRPADVSTTSGVIVNPWAH